MPNTAELAKHEELTFEEFCEALSRLAWIRRNILQAKRGKGEKTMKISVSQSESERRAEFVQHLVGLVRKIEAKLKERVL